jgi:hypothetical protein
VDKDEWGEAESMRVGRTLRTRSRVLPPQFWLLVGGRFSRRGALILAICGSVTIYEGFALAHALWQVVAARLKETKPCVAKGHGQGLSPALAHARRREPPACGCGAAAPAPARGHTCAHTTWLDGRERGLIYEKRSPCSSV